MAYLEDRFGFEVTYLEAKNGIIDLNQLQAALREDTILVSMMFANNETGDLLPIQAVGSMLKQHQAVFHVDAVQAIGKVPIQPADLGIDLLSASAHKFHGPKGTGFLYNQGLKLDSLLHGGNQENKRRAGTESLINIVGMTQALDEAVSRLPQHYQHAKELSQLLLSELEGIPYQLNHNECHLPYIINIGFPGYQNHVLLTQLDLAGFAVSSGSACTAGAVEPSHVLAAYFGKQSHRLTEAIRISFSEQNTQKDVIALATQLKHILGGSYGI